MQRTATNTGHRSNVCYNTTRSPSLVAFHRSVQPFSRAHKGKLSVSLVGLGLSYPRWPGSHYAQQVSRPAHKHTLLAGKYRANMKRANNLIIPNCYQTSILIFDAFRLLPVAVILTTVSASHFALAPQPQNDHRSLRANFASRNTENKQFTLSGKKTILITNSNLGCVRVNFLPPLLLGRSNICFSLPPAILCHFLLQDYSHYLQIFLPSGNKLQCGRGFVA